MWKIEKIVKKGDYLYAVVPTHPHATKNHYVLAHRVVVENHLGRLLNSSEVVHHKDGNKFNNSIENLEILSNSSHVALHGRSNGQKYVRLKCPWCGKIFEKPYRQTFKQKGARFTACSAVCRGKLSRTIQLGRLTHKLELAISENILVVYKKYKDNAEETKTMGSVETIRKQAETPKT